WTEAVNTAAWIINRILNSVTVKTPYEIVYKSKPQLKNVKVFGALGYVHIPNEKRRKLYAKALKCRFLGYEDGMKGYRVLNVTTGKVQIVHTVKFMETTNPQYLMDDEEEQVSTMPVMNGQLSTGSMEIVPADVEAGDVIPLQRDVSGNREIVPYESTHPMITRSRTRHIDETDDPEEGCASKKQIILSSTTGTKRQKMP
ncbi:polyprotein, partial [Phytophthora megakarya]